MPQPKPGKIVIISSPSGGGKTSICRRLLTPARKRDGWTFSVSYTTRTKRRNESNGREYHFVKPDKFRKLVRAGFFVEHFEVHQHHYGTPRKPLESVVKRGGVMILDIDIQGARKIMRQFPDAISIFVLPPSIAEMKKRLRNRGTETREQLAVRFDGALKEMRAFKTGGFDYVVVNKQLEIAARQVLAIITAHNCRVDRTNKEQLRKIIG